MKRHQYCLNRLAVNAITVAPILYIQRTTELFTGLSPSTVQIWWLNIHAHPCRLSLIWFYIALFSQADQAVQQRLRREHIQGLNPQCQSFLLVKTDFVIQMQV